MSTARWTRPRRATSAITNPSPYASYLAQGTQLKTDNAGLEVESLWLPLPDLEITFNFTLNHGNIEEFDDFTVAVVGEPPPEDCTLAIAGLPLVGSTESRGIEWSEPRTYGVELAYTW